MLNFLFSADGKLIEPEEYSLSLNRSFLYGDGFFETIRRSEIGNIGLSAFHADRISRSARLLAFSGLADYSEKNLHQLIEQMNLPQTGKAMKIKLVFFRHGVDGYAPGDDCATFIYATCSDLNLPVMSSIEKIAVSDSVRIIPAPYSGIKSTSALPYVIAGRERKQKGCDEILLLSPDGLVVEGSFTSICWEDSEGIHFTPRELGGIDSCSRRFLEDYFQNASVSFTEKRISPENLMKESLWVCLASALVLRFWSRNQERNFIPGIFSSPEFLQSFD